MRRPARSALLVGLLLAVVAFTTACQDPSPGTPPAKGAAGVPAFESTVQTTDAAMLSASWRPGCPVGPAALRRIRLTYWGYDGKRHWGELIVARSVVGEIQAIFKRFYDVRYQIARMQRVEAFGGSDDRSMAYNNTSAFNCRPVTGGTSWSEHSYGTAIDVNPIQNPYVKGSYVAPEAGRAWVSRSIPTNEVIKANDGWVHTFERYGWKWGGYWTSLKDYQHFSKSGR
jgi:hypothetical protein